MTLSSLGEMIQDLDLDVDELHRETQKILDSRRVAMPNTRHKVGIVTIGYGIYLHDLGLARQIPEDVHYFCTDIEKRFRAWPINARITIDGLQHPIPSTGEQFLDDDIAAALAKLSGTILGEGKARAPFEEHWQGPAELFLLHKPEKPLVDIDFELGWEGGGRALGSCDLGDLRALTQSGRKLEHYTDLPSWVGVSSQL